LVHARRLARRATAATVNPQKIPFVASEPLTQAAKLEKKRRAIVYPKYEYLGGTGSKTRFSTLNADHSGRRLVDGVRADGCARAVRVITVLVALIGEPA
jgi:hypothetical protein